ncbi:MAG: UDP-N-acetylmuramoyl-tripeptide--D-alanyl-D-alanine ligase [Bacteroidia bacterium]|nr:UDP-N-acetylmuramoyl-tripeptide--D-alanyl-D-alanine ligase [Bacteroidia bacterium]MCC6768970.1 UDP-N-acetylmuramoyl-tripeptide--D-alanyl-D-alanine ligase [Bacteroidia bacterium]
MNRTEELYKLYLGHPQVFTDTRSPVKDGIYFALSGPNFNGNLFAQQALEAGAAYAVVDQELTLKDERIIKVADALKALQELALHHRKQLKCKILAITGSNGKTTTKELVASVLKARYQTHYTEGNLNNHIGVPLTLLQIRQGIEIAVIEMGASKPGDIKELCDIAAPDYGLITNIGKAHLEGMGGYEGVVQTKTELYDFLKANSGLVFVNTNHAVFTTKAEGMRQFTFGTSENNEVVGVFEGSAPFASLKWQYCKKGQAQFSEWQHVRSQLIGYYNFENILAAAAVGCFFEVPVQAICKALEDYRPQNNRSQVLDTGKNILIMDAYNANPTSMEAALQNFALNEAKEKVVILGKMMELGAVSAHEHKRIANLAVGLLDTTVLLVGDLYTEIPSGVQHFKQTDDLALWLTAHPLKGKTILIKGSRANRLEQLSSLL